MRPRFQFRIGNMLRATAWVAGSCWAWTTVLGHNLDLPGGFGARAYVIAFAVIFLMVGGPILAVAELLGRTGDILPTALVLTVVTAVALGLLPASHPIARIHGPLLSRLSRRPCYLAAERICAATAGSSKTHATGCG